MCFSQTISLFTAIFEFVIATSILIFFRKSLINRFSVIFVYLLGFYQFTEFMLCKFNNPILWAKLGYVTYTFLPTIILHFTIKLNKQKKPNNKGNKSRANSSLLYILYVIPVIFSLIAIFTKNFVVTSGCSTFFVIIKLAKNQIHSILYTIYYFGFGALACFFLFKKLRKEKSFIKKKIYIIIILAAFVSLIAAKILIETLPSLNIMFPSIYCEFALLFSIAAIIAAELDRISNKKTASAISKYLQIIKSHTNL